ncbi:MAG TPA: metalloregulator ArsR/SmtB family transcription factor [Kofleriaceae bacterium]|nr:metalloregulator ArsR/SmtB family transcription factor [Kofleriaceae bacterium]
MKVTKTRAAIAPNDALLSAVEVFKALGNPQRLAIIHALSHDEHSVGELARSLGMSLTVASQHLAILRRLRLVQGRDDGRLTFYRVIDDVVSHLVHDCLEHCGAPEPARMRRRGAAR